MSNQLFGMGSLELLEHARAHKADPTIVSAVLKEFRRRETRNGKLTGLARRCQEATALLSQSDAPETTLAATARPHNKHPQALVIVGNIPPLYPWQVEALKRWREAGKRGIVEAVTGAGKTVLALTAIQEQLAAGEKTAVVVPTLVLLDQWVDRLADAFPSARIGRLGGGHKDDASNCDILVASVQSGARHYLAPQTGSPLLIADEVHRLGAEVYSQALENRFARRLGLSATWQRKDGAHEDILRPYFGDVVFTLNYARARLDDAICAFRIALVGSELNDTERMAYEAAGAEMSRRRRQLETRFGAPSSANEGEFLAWVNRAKGGEPPGAAVPASMFLQALQNRRKALAEASGKIDAVASMATLAKAAKRTIVFTMTTQAADQIAQTWKASGIACSSFHTGRSTPERERILKGFREGRLQAIVVAKMFDEGVDVPDADLGVIAATSSSRIQLIQRIGRVLRRKPDGRHASLVLLYARETTEDPAQGAHNAALRDIGDAAEAVKTFSMRHEGSLREIGAYLALREAAALQ